MGRGLVLTPASARTLLALRRGTRRPSLGARVEQVYITLLVGAIALAVAWGAIGDAVRNVLRPESWSTWGAPLLLAAVVGALRLGVWQGPVSFSAPDIAHLLSSPASRAGLVRPQLARACALGAVVGAGIAAVGLGGSVAVGETVPAGWFACGVVAAALIGAGAMAVSWLVESSGRAARLVARAGVAAWVPVAAVAAACGAGGAARTAALASGPWGWAVGVTAAGRGLAAVALAGTCAAAAALIALAFRRAGAGTLEGFARRAEARAGLIASAGTGDYRTLAQVRRRSARGDAAGARSRGRVDAASARRTAGARLARAPSPALAIPWRVAIALLREPGRLVTGPVLVAAAVLAGLAHPDRGAWTAAAAVAGFCAATVLLEPLRVEADIPDRTVVLLGRRPDALLAGHCAVPLGLLLTAAVLAAVAAPLVGVTTVAGAAAGLLVAVPACALLLLCAAGSARRGGRIPLEMLSLAAADATGGATILLWLIAWPLGAAAAVSAAVVPAARAGTPFGAAAGLAIGAFALYGFLSRPRQ